MVCADLLFVAENNQTCQGGVSSAFNSHDQTGRKETTFCSLNSSITMSMKSAVPFVHVENDDLAFRQAREQARAHLRPRREVIR